MVVSRRARPVGVCLVVAVLVFLTRALPADAQNRLVNFDDDIPGLPPATGGAGQPSLIYEFPGTTVLVQTSANGINTQPVELTGDPVDWFAMVNVDFTPVSQGTVRIEATTAFDRLLDAFFLQTGASAFGAVVTRLITTSAGEIQDDITRTTVGHYVANQPFRARIDIDMTSATWSVAIDNGPNGFDDDPVVADLPFENPLWAIPYVAAVDAALGLFATIDLPASVAYDDIAVLFGGPQQVLVDIKPDGDPNSVSLTDRGVLPVAILGSDRLNAAQVDPDTIRLGGVKMTSRGSTKVPKLSYSLADVNRDGYDDVIAFFSVQELVSAGALSSATTALVLSGNLFDGTALQGTDAVQIVP